MHCTITILKQVLKEKYYIKYFIMGIDSKMKIM